MRTTVASLRRAASDVLVREAAFARIRESDFVFAGPGSPSYALRNWTDTEVPQLFAEKLRNGGALVLASAAALTVGSYTVPVYEIYKAGEDPYWLPGLDVLSSVGINAAVIPHWDNGEGGDHDTRFCFLGEDRLIALEAELPADTVIIGLDEHTALVIDLDAQVGAVFGRGGVTIRQMGQGEFFPSGEVIPMERLATVAGEVKEGADPPRTPGNENGDRQLARRLLDLEEQTAATAERAKLVEPLVETLLEQRTAARARGDFESADAIRDRLLELGVELSDGPEGTTSFRLAP